MEHHRKQGLRSRGLAQPEGPGSGEHSPEPDWIVAEAMIPAELSSNSPEPEHPPATPQPVTKSTYEDGRKSVRQDNFSTTAAYGHLQWRKHTSEALFCSTLSRLP